MYEFTWLFIQYCRNFFDKNFTKSVAVGTRKFYFRIEGFIDLVLREALFQPVR